MSTFSVSTAILDAIVLSLARHQDIYGYMLTQEIQKVFPVSESTLYPVLRRLQKNHCLNSYDSPCMGRNRRYYRITKTGVETLEQYQNEWSKYKQQIDYFLKEETK